jgi:hypothetical protein
LKEDAAFQQLANVAQGRVGRTFGESGVLRGREESLKIIEHAIDDEPLAVVDRPTVDALPQCGLAKHRGKCPVGTAAARHSPQYMRRIGGIFAARTFAGERIKA